MIAKVEYQAQNKNFRLNDKIIHNLKLIYTALKISNSSIFVVNNVFLDRYDSFIEFSFEWFSFKNVLII